jgi:hypothetical protein
MSLSIFAVGLLFNVTLALVPEARVANPEIPESLTGLVYASDLTPLAPLRGAIAAVPLAEETVAETPPLMIATDWTSFQAAEIATAPATTGFERMLADPVFVKGMYAGYAALQLGDAITTTLALSRGGREANPLLRGIVQSPAALIGVKAASTAATIVLIEKLRRRHPVAAGISMIAINATMAAVTINNMSFVSRTP